MKIFKFGGASVKDSKSVKNVGEILKGFPKENIIVVVSAMGKITNALERLTDAVFFKKENAVVVLNEIKKYHFDIIGELFSNNEHAIYNEINNTFVELDWAIDDEPTENYNYEYDKIVSLGEIISTKIVNAYLNEAGIKSKWVDVRDLIQTDNTYREGKVDWDLTQSLVNERLIPVFKSPLEEPVLSLPKEGKGDDSKIIVTQGFIGGTSENFTTTLGREGSDYTAAILGFTTNAESVTIWKDVPGVLNADPKWFDETKKLEQISYQDAIELAYYGATVIHPKTIKPLQNKKIPLYVRSFLKPAENGTVINDVQSPLPIPCFIFKVNQVLLSISPKDFSFIMEENLSEMFNLFAEKQVKVNVMQNSAISFSVSVDNDERKLPDLIKTLQKQYRVLYNENLELITIRYYDQATIDRVTIDKKVLLEVKSRYTVQLVVKPMV
ncbi:MAG: aspartate kinase [Bacteroidetes bacterium]|nr:aspartate kinase [Bacteroidota bacterium]